MTAAKGGFAGGEGGDRRDGDSRTGSPRASRASRGEDRFSGNGGGGSHSYHSEADVNGAFGCIAFGLLAGWPPTGSVCACLRSFVLAGLFVCSGLYFKRVSLFVVRCSLFGVRCVFRSLNIHTTYS